jgi:hypothetical protein
MPKASKNISPTIEGQGQLLAKAHSLMDAVMWRCQESQSSRQSRSYPPQTTSHTASDSSEMIAGTANTNL